MSLLNPKPFCAVLQDLLSALAEAVQGPPRVDAGFGLGLELEEPRSPPWPTSQLGAAGQSDGAGVTDTLY